MQTSTDFRYVNGIFMVGSELRVRRGMPRFGTGTKLVSSELVLKLICSEGFGQLNS